MKRKVNPAAIEYLEGRADITDEQFKEWFVENANPYYTRAIQKRMDMIDILKMAKKNGCEAYFTKAEDTFDYGFMIFPDGVVMYIQNGDFWGWDFSIEYIPSRWNGTGCRCNDEPVCCVDWNTLLELKADGLRFARELGAKLYNNADDFKAKYWKFKDMVKI